jgi:hypothetical protein
MTAIYGLYDPRDPQQLIMYVGKGLTKRAQSHWKFFLYQGKAINALLCRWFEKLKTEGVVPSWKFLEENVVAWEKAERDWINCVRVINLNLCNLSPGGNEPCYSTERRKELAHAIPEWGAKGGKRTKELHADEQRNWCRKASLIANGNGGIVTNKLHPEKARNLGLKYGPKVAPIGIHYRWHVYRGIINPNCELCQQRKAE